MQIRDGRFLITGGVSLIGSHITEALLAEGAKEVVLFDNHSLGGPEQIPGLLADPRVRAVRGDILRVNELYDAMEGVDGVFACAAFLTLPLSANPPLGLAVNAMGHANVLEACRYRGAGRVVFSSSIAAYGDPAPGLVDETRGFRPAAMSPPGVIYGATKIIGEQLGRLYDQKHGVQQVSLRYSTVYGERQHHRGVNALYIIENYEKMARGDRPVLPGDGSEVHDYIHVADVARANVMAMAAEVSGEAFNIATGVATDLNRLVEILGEIVGADLPPIYSDAGGAVRNTTSTALDFSIDKAAEMLGWRPEVSIEEGIARLVAWRREQDG